MVGTSAGGAMRAQGFLLAVRDRTAASLLQELRDFHSRIFYGTLQIHYGNPRVHYEVWLVHKTGRIEIGLHFESEREENTRAAAALAPHVHAIRAVAGEDAELEQWTASWTRLHVTLPLGPLNEDLCAEVALRLSGLITATRPLLGPHAVLARPQAASHGRRFERRRAGAAR
jgi:hypothetical protein